MCVSPTQPWLNPHSSASLASCPHWFGLGNTSTPKSMSRPLAANASPLAGYGKTRRSPFDRLRANGAGVAISADFPFVLSLSKHEHSFFSTLLAACAADVNAVRDRSLPEECLDTLRP